MKLNKLTISHFGLKEQGTLAGLSIVIIGSPVCFRLCVFALETSFSWNWIYLFAWQDITERMAVLQALEFQQEFEMCIAFNIEDTE